MKNDIKSMDLKELEAEMSILGEKPFRAKQLFQWIHQKLAGSYDDMTNISKELRKSLAKSYPFIKLETVDVKVSKEDGTQKFLFELFDHSVIESVLMKYKHGNSVCISSQVGCRMGCSFCASTIDGLERNLTPSEMLDQIYRIQDISKERVSHVVVMGTGEPLDNYENLIRFIHLINDENGLHISQRNITVSTCGIVPNMRKFAEEGMQVTLALSLHASNDALRKAMMPIANAYSIEELMEASSYFFAKTGRRVTFEYSLIKGMNDDKEHAKELAGLIKEMNCHVNLIPVNPIKERKFKQSEQKEIVGFKNILEKYGINVTIRREMGRDIDGACGQLRRDYRLSNDGIHTFSS